MSGPGSTETLIVAVFGSPKVGGGLVRIGGNITAELGTGGICCGKQTSCEAVALDCYQFSERIRVEPGDWGRELGGWGDLFGKIDGLAVSRDGRSLFAVDQLKYR